MRTTTRCIENEGAMEVPRVRRRPGSDRVGTLRYFHAAGIWLWCCGAWAEWFDQNEGWALWEEHQGEASTPRGGLRHAEV